MKNISLIACLIFSTYGFVAAQTPGVENWQTFAPADEEFSVETPAPLAPGQYGEKDERTVTRRYTNVFNGTYFFIFSDSGKNLLQTKVVRDFVKSFQKSGKSFPAGNLTGEKFEFVDGENFYHTILFVKTNLRSYVFQTVSPTENNHLVGIFFAGIQIKEKDFVKTEESSATMISSESEIAADKNQTKKSVGNAGGIGSGAGNGTGNGVGSKIGSGSGTNINTNTPSLPTQTKGISILSKPRPGYTDFADFYQIIGSVLTRVTFLASGEIGAVTPVTKLPFGLTNQAVIAARGIRFEPAMKDGQPVSVTKQVVYSFTIY